MNWSRIKTILIGLFLVIDLFLLIFNTTLRREGRTVSDRVIEDTQAVLSAQGITVSRALLSAKTPDMSRLSAENVLADEAAFLGRVLGSGYTKDGQTFTRGDKTVTLSGNTFVLREKRRISSVAEAGEWLSDQGFDLSATAQTEYNGLYVFRTMYSGLEVFGSRITARQEGDEAVAEGSFLYIRGAENEKQSQTRHITSVLPRILAEGAKSCEVVGVYPGYMCIQSMQERFTEATANPVYRIVLSDGQEFFYNALK